MLVFVSLATGAQAFSDIYDAVKAAGARIDEADAHALVISPTFYITTDAQKPDQQGRVKNYFDPQRNFAWLSDSQSNGTYGLFDGADAVAPKRGRVSDLLNDVRVSSYDVLDALVAHFADEARFPRLRNLTFAGHSAGAQAFQRWSAINPRSLPSSTSGIGPDGRIHVRFVLANAPSSVYFTTDRPDNPNGATRTSQRTRKDGSISKTGCAFNQWRYGLDGAQPRYVRKRQAEPNDGKELFAQWIRKDVVRLVGTEDTKENANGGDQSCAVRTQGGDNRCERGYAYW